MNSHKLRHTGMIGIRLETSRGHAVIPKPFFKIDPIVRDFCDRYNFPLPTDKADEKNIKGTYIYAEYAFRRSCKRLGLAILKTVENDRNKIRSFMVRHIRGIFSTVVIVGLTTIVLYILQNFIF